MKLAGKIDTPDEVKAHLQELSDFQVSVRLFSKEGTFLSKGSFSCEFESGGGLFFTPIPPDGSQCAALTFHYSYEAIACVFQTRPRQIENSKLYLELPASILFFDRRKCFRIQPSKKRPVVIRMTIPGKGEMRLLASEIGAGGFSMLMPARMDFFRIGMILSLSVELSGEDKIRCRVLIKGLYSFLSVTRVGCEFSDISEKDRSVIVSSCVRRELEMRNAPDAPDASGNEWQNLNVCIVDEASGNKPYSFLEDFFSIKTVEPLKAIPHLKQKPPDLMVINTDNAGARLILAAVSRDPLLKELPLILIGKNNSHPNARSGAVAVIKSPYKKKYLLKSIRNKANFKSSN